MCSLFAGTLSNYISQAPCTRPGVIDQTVSVARNRVITSLGSSILYFKASYCRLNPPPLLGLSF